jgi:uncharacterized protein (TIGR03435 family)
MLSRRLRTLPLLIALVSTPRSHAQSDAAPAFEVATVKINKTGGGNGMFPTPGRLRVTNYTLQQLIQTAYHVKTGMLFGVNGWMQIDRYDIDAKAAGNSSFDDDLVMLQALLAERFQLRFHREIRQIASLALVAAKSGTKLHASKADGQKEHLTVLPSEISGDHIPFGHFVTILQGQLKLPITNETGISGNYDLTLKYAREDSPEAAGAPSIFAALEEQLGLKLEAWKGPVEVMVIDSATKPREN